jgi:hypothetical protein
LDSVRELKASLTEAIIKPMAASPVARAAMGLAAQPMANAGGAGPTMALGIVRKTNQDYHLAVRIQRRGLENSSQLDTIKLTAAVVSAAAARIVPLGGPRHAVDPTPRPLLRRPIDTKGTGIMNRTTLDDARTAKTKAVAAFGDDPSVVGVGITRIGEGYGVKLNLEAPPAADTKLPKDIDGVPIRVEVIGTIRKR